MTPVDKFELLLKALKFPEPEREYPFAKAIGRKWRFDYAWPDVRSECYYDDFIHCPVALEIDGGNFSGGRHVRPIGFEKDCEKINEAQRLGWKVYRFTPSMITAENMEWLKKEVE